MSDPPGMHSPLPAGARCAMHPERVAERTCVRCGNYMCSDCAASGDAGICLTCANRVGPGGGAFPYSRDHYTLDGLLNLALSRWKTNWPLLLVTFGAALVVIYGTSFAGEAVFMLLSSREGSDEALLSPLHPARIAFMFVGSVLQLGAQLVLTGLCLDLLRGAEPDRAVALQRLRRLPEAFLQTLVAYSAIALDAVLHYGLYQALGGWDAGFTPLWIVAVTWVIGIPLRLYVFLGVLFCQLVLLVDPNANAFTAFASSFRVVSGHRFEVLGIGIVALLIIALGVIACCVGLLAALPVASLLYCGLFLALSTEKPPSAALRQQHFEV